MLLLILLLAAATGLVVISSGIRKIIIEKAGTFLFGNQVTDIPYCTIMLISNSFKFGLLLIYATIATIFFDKVKNLFIKNYKIFFSICIIAFFVTSNMAIIASRFFVGYANIWDFADFVSVIEYYAKSNIYGTNYPPLAVLFYKLIYLIVPSIPGIEKSFAINYLLNLYILGTALALFILFFHSTPGTLREKLFCGCVMFLTGPILFAYQRMNLILLALIGTFGFVLFYSSKNKYLKEFALISLAVAANIKLFPAIFGALLLKEKRWKESFRAAGYGIAMFIIPIMLSNFFQPKQINLASDSNVQYEIIQAAYKNTTSTVEAVPVSLIDTTKNFFESSRGFAANPQVMTSVSIKAIVYRLLSNSSLQHNTIQVIMLLSVIFCFLLLLFCFFISKKKYQDFILLSLMCIFIPTSSAWYGLIFLLIPLTYYFDTSNKDKIDYIISILFILIFAYCFGYFKFLQPQSCWHIIGLWLIVTGDIIFTRFFLHKEKQR